MDEAWPKGAPKVGQRAERSRKVDAMDIELFTRISGDRNPLHYDEKTAKSNRGPGRNHQRYFERGGC
jgi:acyl dehydratase